MSESIGFLSIGEPNAVIWEGLYDVVAMIQAGRSVPAAADYDNASTATWVTRAAASDGSYDAAGALVTNGGGTLTYVTGSNGTRVGVMAANAVLTLGATYYVIMTASSGAQRKIKYVASLHGSTP